MLTAHQARTSLVFGAAGTALVAALLLTPGRGAMTDPTSMSSDILTAKLSSQTILAGDHEQDIAVTIRMPKGTAQATRPPISLAIVIDRSGSMEGEPLANAKAAAARLVDQLAPSDAFTIVTYSSSVETVVPMTRVTAAAKAAARDAIEQIYDEGNTCISCGIQQGDSELAHSPIVGGLSRMVLISDGQANSGLSDRNDLAQLATQTAAHGVSISTVGVGLDFDEVTMTRLADVGHGHYYFVEDTKNLASMFREELDGMTETVAADVRLVVRGIDANVLDAYGYPVVRGREDVVIPIADLRAGETRKVVLRVNIPTDAVGTLEVARFQLDWRRVSDGRTDAARTNLVATLTHDLHEVAATIDRNAVNAIETARTARVLEDAAQTYETQGAEAAQRVLDRHMREVRDNKNIDAPAMQMIERASNGAADNFAKAPPTKAKKATRADAYQLAH